MRLTWRTDGRMRIYSPTCRDLVILRKYDATSNERIISQLSFSRCPSVPLPNIKQSQVPTNLHTPTFHSPLPNLSPLKSFFLPCCPEASVIDIVIVVVDVIVAFVIIVIVVIIVTVIFVIAVRSMPRRSISSWYNAVVV